MMNLSIIKLGSMQKKRRFFYFIPFIVLAIILLLSGLVMLLWNGVLTDIVNVRPISYGQAIGLFVLCRILFGSFRPGPSTGFRRGPHWKTKLMNLTPEERERLRKEWFQRGSETEDSGGDRA
jgi:hypothetical protein